MSDIQALQDSLAKKQAELAALQRELAAARQAQFAELPATVGLSSVDALIKALADFASPRMKGALKSVFAVKTVKAAPRSAAKAEAPAKAGKRKRARVTPELKDQIIKALNAGEKTAVAVAAEFGVSGATVNNIKKQAGLTKNKAKK